MKWHQRLASGLINQVSLSIFSKSAIDYAAKFNPTALKQLLSNGWADINDNTNKFTPLYLSIMEKQYQNTILLLKYKADPNVPNNTKYSKDTPLEFSVILADESNIMLLGMHGATAEDIDFTNRETTLDWVNAALELKKIYDVLLADAEAALDESNVNESFNCFKKAGDIWFDLAASEKITDYRLYYYENAYAIYRRAYDCYKQLANINSTFVSIQHNKELFSNLTETCRYLNKNNEERFFAGVTAKFIVDKKTALLSSKQKVGEEQQGSSLILFSNGIKKRRLKQIETEPLLRNFTSFI